MQCPSWECFGERLLRLCEAPFELKDMARIAFLSPYYFNRVFRQVTGVPPRRFHMALRMAEPRTASPTPLAHPDRCASGISRSRTG